MQPTKQKVQFRLTPESAHSHGVRDIDLPADAHARITIATSEGTSVLSSQDVSVFNNNGVYLTEPVELTPGSYTVTELMIISDSTELYVTPRKGAEFATSETDALPLNFAIQATDVLTVPMRIINVGDEDLRKFGYPAAKAKTLSLEVFDKSQGNRSTGATAELRQNKSLVQVLSLSAGINAITLEGDPKLPYTLTVYTGTAARVQTFTMKQLKKDIGKKPWRIVLEPALVMAIESYTEEDYEYEQYFDFRMEGGGNVTVNWGDGEESAIALPFEVAHQYSSGNYTAIITGDLHGVTDFSGFSYYSIIKSIDGLTNLTGLKTYNPSWGAVPINVDLSNCTQLETINIAKYGAPYEPIDLRTDFKLPTQHNINTFIFDAPSLGPDREFISAEELATFVNNVHGNAVARNISNGKFFVNPVVSPSVETQQKLDVLTGDYSWQVGFNDDIYNIDYSARSRKASEPNESREQWLRERFSNSEQIIERGRAFSSVN